MSSEVVVRPFRTRCWSAACLFALAACLACRADEPEPAEEKPATAEEKKPVVDQKIESAVAAAQKSAQAGGAKADGQPAPPEDGVMDVEAAARELAAGAAAEIVFGGAGSEPRVSLAVDVGQAAAPPSGQLSISYRSGGSMMPTVELALEPKRTPVAEGAGDIGTRFLVRGAAPAQAQPGRLPENAKAEIAKLTKSSIEFVTTARGAAKGSRAEMGGNSPGLMPLLNGAADALASVVLPYPEQPVGAGAFWMVKSRETQNGAPVIAYRMVKVSKIENGVAELEIATRRYLLTRVLPIESLPPHRVRQFESEGKARSSLRPGSAYPHQAEIEDVFTAIVSPNDRPNQAAPIQSEATVSISFGG